MGPLHISKPVFWFFFNFFFFLKWWIMIISSLIAALTCYLLNSKLLQEALLIDVYKSTYYVLPWNSAKVNTCKSLKLHKPHSGTWNKDHEIIGTSLVDDGRNIEAPAEQFGTIFLFFLFLDCETWTKPIPLTDFVSVWRFDLFLFSFRYSIVPNV